MELSAIILKLRKEIEVAERYDNEERVLKLEKELRDYEKDLFEKSDDSEVVDESLKKDKRNSEEKTIKEDKSKIPEPEVSEDTTKKDEEIKEETTNKEGGLKVNSADDGEKKDKRNSEEKTIKEDRSKRSREYIREIRKEGLDDRSVFVKFPGKVFKFIKNKFIDQPIKFVKSIFNRQLDKEIINFENRKRLIMSPGYKTLSILSSALVSGQNKKLENSQFQYDALDEEIKEVEDFITEIDNEKVYLEEKGDISFEEKKSLENQKIKALKRLNTLKIKREFIRTKLEVNRGYQKIQKEFLDLNIRELVRVLDNNLNPLIKKQEELNLEAEEMEFALDDLKGKIKEREDKIREIHEKISKKPKLRSLYKTRQKRLNNEISKGRDIAFREELKLIEVKKRLNSVNERIDNWKNMRNKYIGLRDVHKSDYQAPKREKDLEL